MKVKTYLKDRFLRFEYCPFCHGGDSRDRFSFYIDLKTQRGVCVRQKCQKQVFASEVMKAVKSNGGLDLETWKGVLRNYFELRGCYNQELLKSLVSLNSEGELVFLYNGFKKVRLFPSKAFRIEKIRQNVEVGSEFFALPYVLEKFGKEEVFVCFGEFDALTLLNLGFPAVSSAVGDSGVSSIARLASIFNSVYVCFDNDRNYMSLVEKLKKLDIRCKIINRSFYKGKKDINDVFVEFGKSAFENFRDEFVEPSSVLPFFIISASQVETKPVTSADFGFSTYFSLFDRATLGFHRQTLNVISGPGGSGKTTLMLNFLVKFSKQKIKSLYYTTEQSLYEIKRILERIVAGRDNIVVTENEHGFEFYNVTNLDKSLLDNIYLSSSVLNPIDHQTLDDVKEVIKKYDISVLVIDNLMGMSVASDDYYKTQAKVVDKLKSLARELDIAVFLVTHTRKNTGSELVGADIEGTAKIRNYADTVILIQRDEDVTKLILDKNRNVLTGGRTVSLKLLFDEISFRFYDSYDYEKFTEQGEEYDFYGYPSRKREKTTRVDKHEFKVEEKNDNSGSTGFDSVKSLPPARFDNGNEEDNVVHCEVVDTQVSSEDISKSDLKIGRFLGEFYGAKYYLAETEEDIDNFFKLKLDKDLVSIDTETTGSSFSRKVVCCSFGFRIDGKYFGLCVERNLLHKLVEFPVWWKVVGHNVKFDLVSLMKEFPFKMPGTVYDTMLLAILLYPERSPVELDLSRFSLDSLSYDFLGIEKTEIKDFFTGRYEDLEFSEELARYNIEDAVCCLRILVHMGSRYLVFVEREKNEGLIEAEMNTLKAVVEAEVEGIKIDLSKVDEIKKKIKERCSELVEKLKETEEAKQAVEELFADKKLKKKEFNPDSTLIRNKFLELCEANGKIELKRTEKGNVSFSKQDRSGVEYDYEPLNWLNEYLLFRKFSTSNVERILKHVTDDSRIHADFLVSGAISGRMLSRNPNIQNITESSVFSLRELFVADEGKKFIIADYSQIELRLLALLAKSRKLINAFLEEKDIHTYMASLLFKKPEEEVTKEERKRAKTITFGLLYGMGVNKLASQLKISKKEAEELFEAYKNIFSEIFKKRGQVSRDVQRFLFVTTMFGRRRYFIKDDAGNIDKLNASFNHIIQGTATDIFKLGVMTIYKAREKAGLVDKIRFRNFIHDEIVLEVDEDFVEEGITLVKGSMDMVVCLREYDYFKGVFRVLDDYSIPIVSDVEVANSWSKSK